MSRKNRATKLGRVINKRKRKDSENEGKQDEEQEEVPPTTRSSDEPPPKKTKWINRQRILVFGATGITQRDRHLMNDLKRIMPHSKNENKISRREHLAVVNELCEVKNCNKALFFEARKKLDLYMWVANVPHGPSAKFLVESVFTMGELRLTGNCLKGSRPIISFDENFDKHPHFALLKELFTQVFGVPNHHPKSQPFVDRVISFSVLDNRIWYRHYQILQEDGALAEIGPRFVLNPIKIFSGSFTGTTLWDNPHYVTPSAYRRQMKAAAGTKYLNRQQQKIQYMARMPDTTYSTLPEDEVFEGDTLSKAAEIVGIDEPPAKIPQNPISFKKKKRAGKKSQKKNQSELPT